MLRGSRTKFNPGHLEPKNPPENEDFNILITHLVSPQQFSYVKRKDVEASASLVREMEKVLAKYSTNDKKKSPYLVNQNVIVQYKPVSPPKLLRGMVKKREDENYLVWMLDYGFTLCCSSVDMWPLPDSLSRTIWDVLDGSIAYIGSNRSISVLRDFDKLMEGAIDLKLEVKHGKILFKSATQSKVFQNGCEFMLSGKQTMLETSSSAALSFDLAEINEPMIEAHPRVKFMMQLVASDNPSSETPTPVLQLPSKQKHIYTVKVMGKKGTWSGSGSGQRNLTRPLDQVLKLNNFRSNEQVLRREGRFKTSEGAPSNMEFMVADALDEGNNADSDKESVYEDAQLPDFFEKNPELQEDGRSSPSASSQRATDEMYYSDNDVFQDLSSALTDDFKASKSATESLPPRKPLRTTSDGQKVEAIPIPSSSLVTTKKATSSVPKSGKKQKKEKLDRYNELLGKRDNVPPIAPEYKVPSLTKDNIFSLSSVLAHGRIWVYPVTKPDELPLNREIQKTMSDLNIHSPHPTQMYAWPHLLSGGSLVLVDGCGKGRSWSYLPVLCSTVHRSLENSGKDRGPKLGPLAILLVDATSRCHALASECTILMPKPSDPEQIGVVNTHGHSFPACQMMLLNSCGILVTTPDHLLELLDHEIAMIDPKRLVYFIFDDFDRLRLTTPQLLDAVLQKLYGWATGPSMQLVVVAQKWVSKEFEKLLRRMASPLALFGDFLEAAMYGGLQMKFTLKKSELKMELLLQFLAKQKAFKRRTLIYCKYVRELASLQGILTRAGHECIGFSEGQDQQPHQVMLRSDEVHQLSEEVPLCTPKPNIEVLVHFSLPESWSKFVNRFHAMADQFPNYFTAKPQKEDTKQPLLSYVLLDDSNQKEYQRLTEFLCAHGVATDEIPWVDWQPPTDESIPYCPYLLSRGECRMPCRKRHDFIPADMPAPEDPLQQPGTVIRCKLYKTYDPGHLAVWPLEYQTKGSAAWLDAPHPVNQWIAAVEMEMGMGTKRKVHDPYRLGDVCIVYHLGLFKRVKIVDIQPKGQVTVQMMDYGTELMEVKFHQLLQCPEQKFRALPPLAMDIRLSGVGAGEGKRSADTTQWVQEVFGALSERQQMQLTVDFAMLNVVYAKEVTLVEECPSMRTSVYKVLLRKELVSRGFGQKDSLNVQQLRGMQEQQARANKDREANKENIELATRKTCPSSPKAVPKEPSNIPVITSKVIKPKPVKVDSNRFQIKQEKLPSDESTIKAESPKEAITVSSTEAESDQPSTSSAAFYKALMHELYTKSPSKKQGTRDFLQSILEGSDDNADAITEKKPSARRELKLEDVPQAATPAAKPVAQSLQFSAVSKDAVRPRVKWYQTSSHIELSIEQKMPDYKLWLEGNTLFYMSTTTSPPQHFVLPLLREVRLISEKQHGYYLKVKLAKAGILTDWPTLLSSVYAQQSAHWLTYDAERAEEPEPPASLMMWERYLRCTPQPKCEEYSSDDEDEYNSEIYEEEGVERCDTATICDDV